MSEDFPPIQIIIVPPAAREIEIDMLPVSVRLWNVLSEMGCRKLSDLQGKNYGEVYETKNCGAKTVAELEDFMMQLSSPALIERLITDVSPALAANLLDISPSEDSVADLLRFIEKFSAALRDKERDVLMSRFGANGGEPQTLAGIGKKYGVTKERVRQIQNKTLEKLKARLGGGAVNRIHRNCVAAVCPLSPRLLTEWAGEETRLEYPAAFYIRLLAELEPEIPILLDERRKLDQVPTHWRKIRRATRDFLQRRADREFQLADVFRELKSTETFADLSEKDFIEAVQSDAALDLDFENPAAPTFKVAKIRTVSWARVVLSQSDSPLLPEEILKRAKDVFGAEAVTITPRSLANILLNWGEGFYLLGRRAIGLRKHFRLPPHRWNAARNDFYNLLTKLNRPVSTTEVIAGKMFDWTTEINATEAAQILREDKRFKDLRRFHFALAEWQIEKRGHLRDLAVEVLKTANRPLTKAEIWQAMQEARSVAPTSMPMILSANENLKHFGAGFYGLKKWGNKAAKFLVVNRKFVNRLVSLSKPPLTFGDLCQKLEIADTGTLADKLWRTLRKLPKVRFKSAAKAAETHLAHENWRFNQAIQTVLEQAARPLSLPEIQSELNRIFGGMFDRKKLNSIKRILRNNAQFIRNQTGEFSLDPQIENPAAGTNDF